MLKKKIFLFLILGLFLISFTSAGLFDPNSEVVFHEYGKNGNYGYYEINDTDFWFFNNNPIKTIELIENDYSVLSAWNIKEIEVFKSTKLFDKTNYLDKEQKNDKSNLLNSETHLYREWETKIRVISSFECSKHDTITNATNSYQVCVNQQDNSYDEEYEEWGDWKLYNFQTVQEGLYQTKTIVTRNSQNTGVIDWVDENEGHSLDEWATWWDTDWEKKRLINLTANVGNFSFIERINYSASMNSDFSDVRFINSAETEELNYTIESKVDSSYMMVRIYSKGETNIYMYYGNSGATTSTSSSINTHFRPTNYWYFDENSGTNAVDSIENYNGTANNARVFTAETPGKFNFSADFTQGNDYIEVNGGAPTGGASSGISYSFEGWINFPDEASRTIIGIGNSATSNTLIRLIAENQNGITSNLVLNSRHDGTGAGGLRIITDVSVGTSTWTHIAYTINNGAVKIYVNGINVKNSSLMVGTYTLNGMNIGALYNGGTPAAFANGLIDEPKIFNRTLTNDEILQLYTYTAPTYTVESEEANVGVSTILISPENNENILNNTVKFNFTSIPTQTNLTNATLYIWMNNGTLVNTNFTTLSGNESVNITFINTLIDGMYKWNAETCGENVDCSFASSNNTFIVHVTPITIDISYPTGTIDFMKVGDNQTLNWTLTEDGENLTEHVINCSYTYNGVVTYLTIPTCIVTNTTNFTYIFGVNNLTFNATDKFNLTSSNTTTWDLLFNYWDIDYTTPLYESTQGVFVLNTSLKDGETIEQAIFNYNGTNYTTSIITSGGQYLITSSIILPSVSSDTNFTFSFYVVVDGITYNFLEETQEILNIGFITCAGLDLLMNISLFDEGDKTSILGDIELNMQVYSKTSDSAVAELNNTYENISSQAICLSPNASFSNLYLDAEIRYFKEDYATEFYYIQDADLVDYPINLSLFDLDLNDSTEFTVTYKNNDFIFEEDAIIQLQRKYIGEDSYEVVEAPITGDGGKAILHIDLNSNKYQASVVKDGEVLDFFDNIIFSCANELSGDCTHSLDGTVDPNNDVPIEDITDFSYSISIDEDNQTVTVLFAVPSGTPSSINVLLNQIDMFGNLSSCNTTVITSAGSITCEYTDTIEKSILELSISKNDVQLAIFSYVNDPDLDMDGMNFFIVFLFMISLVGMAISSPEWMILISVMVLIISGTLLLLKGMSLVMGLGAIAWVVVAAAIIIMKMSKQEDR